MDPAELSDRTEINDLLDDYSHGIDTRDFELVASLFTAEARLDYTSSGCPAGSRDEVIAWLRASLSAVAMTQHLLTNRRIRVEGDTATATTKLFNPLAFVDANDEAQIMLLGGSYEDRFERTIDGWRIVDRVHTTTWTSATVPGQLHGGKA